MKKLVVLWITFLGVSAFSASFEIEVTLKESGEVVNTKLRGWQEDEEGAYVFQKIFQMNKIPWRTDVGRFSLSLEKDGLFTLDYSYGDMDGGASTTFKLPQNGKRFLIPPEPFALTLSGGDHASGAWFCEGAVRISVTEN